MKLLPALAILAASIAAHADVTLPKLLSSHMVLQRNMPIHIWGDAAPGEQITVDLHGATASTTADNLHRWSVYLPAQPAGGPFTLTIRAANTITLDDILIGDLWLASGQSNMEMPLAGFNTATPVKDSAKEIAAATNPQIRLLQVKKDSSDYPLEDLKAVAGWSQCSPDTAKSFSAAAYFFGRASPAKRERPHRPHRLHLGRLSAEAWTSMDALGADPSLSSVFAARARHMDIETTQQRIDAVNKQARADHKPTIPNPEYHPDQLSWRPAGLYNAMIAPLTPLAIRGVIWYQGESNATLNRTADYTHLFAAMIQDWRAQWQQGNFPFLFAQIASYTASPHESWGALRDAQRRTLYLANTGMAVILDVGEAHNIHPADKQTVGERLALQARSIAYGENITANGPLFQLAYPDRAAIHIWFHNAEGLKSQDPLQGFEIAGSDGNFLPATAAIEGETVIATNPSIPNPKYVRYAWPNFPQANLYNAANLPTSTFTTYPPQ